MPEVHQRGASTKEIKDRTRYHSVKSLEQVAPILLMKQSLSISSKLADEIAKA
jgi:hypothetical protein